MHNNETSFQMVEFVNIAVLFGDFLEIHITSEPVF